PGILFCRRRLAPASRCSRPTWRRCSYRLLRVDGLLAAARPLLTRKRVHVGRRFSVSPLWVREEIFAPREAVRARWLPCGYRHLRRAAPTSRATAGAQSDERLGRASPRRLDVAGPGRLRAVNGLPVQSAHGANGCEYGCNPEPFRVAADDRERVSYRDRSPGPGWSHRRSNAKRSGQIAASLWRCLVRSRLSPDFECRGPECDGCRALALLPKCRFHSLCGWLRGRASPAGAKSCRGRGLSRRCRSQCPELRSQWRLAY